jgi:geranylgeranyl diphosphate synthase type I
VQNLELNAMAHPDLALGQELRLGGLLQLRVEEWWGGDDPLAVMARHALLAPGKLLRPMLLIEAGAAVGGVLAQLLPAALGTEFGHVASLVHDDIIDGDGTRRGRPSVLAEFGRDNAILVGDALFFALFSSLADCHREGVSAERVVRAMRVVASAATELCRGQLLESALSADLACTPEQYFQMIRGKTAALFRGSAVAGAILGGGSDAQVAALGRYGEQLGLAFQIVDDLLPYISRSPATGKPDASDLENRRMTLPVINARRLAGAGDRAELDRLFSRARPETADFGRLRELVRRTGAVEETFGEAKRHRSAAKEALLALPDTGSRTSLAGLADLATDREF